MVSYAAAQGIELSTKTSLLAISDARIDARTKARPQLCVVLTLMRSNWRNCQSSSGSCERMVPTPCASSIYGMT